MRMCEHEGEFLPGVYYALRDDLSWAETQRIMTSMTVLADERADYNEWFLKNAERLRKRTAANASQSRGRAPVLADYERELAEQRQGLANAEADLSKHRNASVRGLGPEDGLLDPSVVEFVEAAIEVHRLQIERLEPVIAKHTAAVAATL